MLYYFWAQERTLPVLANSRMLAAPTIHLALLGWWLCYILLSHELQLHKVFVAVRYLVEISLASCVWRRVQSAVQIINGI